MAKNLALRAYKAGISAKKKGHHHNPKMTLPISVLAGFAVPVVRIVDTGMQSGMRAATDLASMAFTGYDPSTGKFNWAMLKWGTGPVIAGILVHKFIGGTLGVNRALARAGVPVLRL